MSQSLHPEKPILMVDDEESWLVSLETLLARHGQINNVVLCTDSSKVMGLLAEREFSMVLLDYGMPGISGEELLPQIVVLYPKLPVVMLTGYDYVNIALRCKDLGAANYFIKTEGEMTLALKILEILWAHITPPPISVSLTHPDLFTDVVANSTGMKSACQALDAAIDSREHLFLVGEKGVGKGFLARKLMMQRTGKISEFDAENSEDVHFTDEDWVNKLLTETRDGHVYLENIDALDKESQLQLLKLLQQKLDARFILTFSVPETAKGEVLREDLFHLLKTHEVVIPPLRERKEDLPELTNSLIQQAASDYGKKPPTPPPELNLLLQSYVFPGNVKELKTMVFEAVKSHQSRKMSMDSFKQAMLPVNKSRKPELRFSEVLPTIEETVSMLIDEAEKRAEGNQSIMADLLGISRQSLNKRLQRRQKK